MVIDRIWLHSWLVFSQYAYVFGCYNCTSDTCNMKLIL